MRGGRGGGEAGSVPWAGGGECQRGPDRLCIEAHGDARKIVEPLIRELRLPTELIPATPPAGRGDEATPTS